ncbi:MAG TPA: VOC family protein [Stackebrandtia sp.]|jgi:predicted enzyme related to lactoylglutathione lyase|uniref:VOC family protein n=1 Tax=Stackebrandtia sp. TaxID=2023065 RepID=UPI002D67AB22|nr:VOC family protein [Stackebrandtia sp.]HZE37371.1 VOC family protein [Stackebrandtia sp.]
MDALHPRLLVRDFAACFGFYSALLPAAAGATLRKGGPEGPYAHWDLGDEGLLSMFSHAAMADALGLSASDSGDRTMLVLRVSDVDAVARVAAEAGGRVVAAPADRPEWGPNLRAAHLRDPDGNLLEFQSY